jgi:hypothetical protein
MPTIKQENGGIIMRDSGLDHDLRIDHQQVTQRQKGSQAVPARTFGRTMGATFGQVKIGIQTNGKNAA